MNILYIPDGQILAIGDFVETDDLLTYPDQIVPKHVVPSYVIVDVTLPHDFAYGKYLYQNNEFVANPEWANPNLQSTTN